MADKITYTVNRAMHGDGRDYERGDTRQMTAADAAELVALGALSKQGDEPAVRAPAVRHTFGTEPSRIAERGYTTPTGDGVIVGTPAIEQVAPVAAPAGQPTAVNPRARRG